MTTEKLLKDLFRELAESNPAKIKVLDLMEKAAEAAEQAGLIPERVKPIEMVEYVMGYTGMMSILMNSHNMWSWLSDDLEKDLARVSSIVVESLSAEDEKAKQLHVQHIMAQMLLTGMVIGMGRGEKNGGG